MTETHRQTADQAMQEQARLNGRIVAIDAEIQREWDRLGKDLVKQARMGQVPDVEAVHERIEELEAERRRLPLAKFVAQVQGVAARVAEQSREEQRLLPEIQRAREELEPLEAAEQEAVAKAEEKRRELSRLERTREIAKERRVQQERALRSLENEGPRALPDEQGPAPVSRSRTMFVPR